MHIESGATRDRRIRMTLVTAGSLFMAGYFAYDGWIGYPAANLEQLKKLTPPDAVGQVVVDPRVVEELRGKSLDELKSILGEPPMKLPTEYRYFGEGGYLSIPVRQEGGILWNKLQHSGADLLGQKTLAGALGLVGLYLLINLRSIFAMRIVLDDNGLQPAPGRSIKWENMTALDSSRYKDKGWVDLKYDDGRERTYRIDSFHVDQFKPIVREICSRKGFASPLPNE